MTITKRNGRYNEDPSETFMPKNITYKKKN